MQNIMSEKVNLYSIHDKIVLSLYSLYFILKPFYFWSSGLPQVSDIISVIAIIYFVLYKKLKLKIEKDAKPVLLSIIMFISYVTLINIIYMNILGYSFDFFISTTFYIYNGIIAIFTSILYFEYRNKIIDIIYKSVTTSIIIQGIVFLLEGGFIGSRATASFNNPNQLAYHVVLTIAIILIATNYLKFKFKWMVITLIVSIVLILASLSKAGILSSILMIILYLISKNKNKSIKWKMVLLIFVLVIGIYFLKDRPFIQENSLLISVQNRLSQIGEDDDDSLEGRGYDRIFNHPEYWIFGSGEGATYRFGNKIGEFHSTIGNIQVSYGLFGTILFLRIILLCLRRDKYINWYVILSILVYGLTHNGIRNSILWIIIALIGCKKKY